MSRVTKEQSELYEKQLRKFLEKPTYEVSSKYTERFTKETTEKISFSAKVIPESKQAVPSQNKIDHLKKIYKLDDNQINQVIATDPTKNQTDYVSWIAKQLSEGKIILPEDTEKIKGQLTIFDKLKRSPKFNGNKDIQGYTPASLYDTVNEHKEETSRKEQTRELKSEGKPGAKIIYNQNGIVVYEVSDVAALMELSSNTNWCTTQSSFAAGYLRSGPNYVIYKNNKPYAQYDPNTDQLLDTKDGEFPEGDLYNILDPVIVQVVKALPEVFKNILVEPLDKEKALKSPKLAYTYAKNVIKGVFPEGEKIIATDAKHSYDYAKNVIKEVFPKGEEIIVTDALYSFYYAKDVIKGRFPEGEAAIATDAFYSYYYAMNVINRIFPEGEKAIATDASYSYNYAMNVIKGRFPEGEKIIATNAFCSYDYARNIIKGVFPEGEAIIATNPELSSTYARDILHSRFPAGEKAIATDAFCSYNYAKNIIKGRFSEGEAIIATNPEVSSKYTERFAEEIAEGPPFLAKVTQASDQKETTPDSTKE